MALKDKLRSLLDERQMKPAELARRAELTEATISYYLSGKKEPRGRTCAKLAEALGVSVDDLLETGFAPGESAVDALTNLPPERRAFVDKVLTLNEEDFAMVCDIFDAVLQRREKPPL